MRTALQQNAGFGIAKSALAYGFIVVLYRLAPPEQIQAYIRYEIALALTILCTAGLQSQSYKELDPRGLHLLSVAGLLLLGGAVLGGWLAGAGPWLMVQLVLLDRLAEIQLQGTRQDGRFLRYNLLETGGQLLTKGGFLLVAMGWTAWPLLLAVKAAASLGWLLVRRWRWQGAGFLTPPRRLFASRREWLHYLGFDILNYSAGQLDLLLLTSLAPVPVLTAYFYVRKFVRLPLVLLNYVLDPTYVHLRGLADPGRRRWILQRLLAWSVAGMILFAWVLVPVLAWTSRDPAIAQLAALLFATAHFWVLQRFLDLGSLLYWPQGRRTASRLAGTLANAAPLLLPLAGLDWALSLSLIPWLAWAANLVFIIRRLDLGQSLLLCGSLLALAVLAARLPFTLAESRWLQAGLWPSLLAALALVGASAWRGLRSFHTLVETEGEDASAHP